MSTTTWMIKAVLASVGINSQFRFLAAAKCALCCALATSLVTAGVLADKPQTSPPTVSAPPTAPAAKPTEKTDKRKPDASDEFFSKGAIPWLRIEIAESELIQLRKDNRQYVRCTVKEGDKSKADNAVYADVGIHLKGAAGSFREIDDRPALSLNFDKFKKKQAFHAIDKMHLNNSVQDNTYLHELICSELFLSAGIPACRTSHARVFLNNRDLGLYVLKEGFDRKFLKRHFSDTSGNLYDGGFCQEIDGELKKQTGDGPDDRSDLQTLVAACREPNETERAKRVAEQIDVDKFLTFMALEHMTGHWDGYCLKANNYRVYFDPASKRWQFFPHGMDQMFADESVSILKEPPALVANAVYKNAEWRAKYRGRVAELLPLIAPPEKLLARIDALHARLRPAIADISPEAARRHDDEVKGLKDRIVARAKQLTEQSAAK